MRRRHPWWALLAATALVVASLLAPMEGAAYRMDDPGNPVNRGDPDNPGDQPQPGLANKAPAQLVVMVSPFPGLVLRFVLHGRTSPTLTSHRGAQR
jgi:hypothetical protein